jgi:hypothetical protein
VEYGNTHTYIKTHRQLPSLLLSAREGLDNDQKTISTFLTATSVKVGHLFSMLELSSALDSDGKQSRLFERQYSMFD